MAPGKENGSMFPWEHGKQGGRMLLREQERVSSNANLSNTILKVKNAHTCAYSY